MGGQKWHDCFKQYVKICLSFLPAVIWIIVQFFAAFQTEAETKIGVSFAHGLSRYTPSLFVSFVLAFAFTLIVFVADYKNILKSVTAQLTCCYVFWAWLEAVFIYETGERELHGNWLWGYNAAMFILWGVSLIKFFEYARKCDASKCKNKIIVPLGITVFFVQVLCGLDRKSVV